MLLEIETTKNKQVIDITDRIQDLLKQNSPDASNCHIFVLHTTAAVSTADLDPGGTDLDYLSAFSQIAPNLKYNHPHNPTHFPDHLLATLIGPSLQVPVQNGNLVLGAWQRIVLFEFDGPRKRVVNISIKT